MCGRLLLMWFLDLKELDHIPGASCWGYSGNLLYSTLYHLGFPLEPCIGWKGLRLSKTDLPARSSPFIPTIVTPGPGEHSLKKVIVCWSSSL